MSSMTHSTTMYAVVVVVYHTPYALPRLYIVFKHFLQFFRLARTGLFLLKLPRAVGAGVKQTTSGRRVRTRTWTLLCLPELFCPLPLSAFTTCNT
mmetsp:Transcript_5430/g.6256  ORF Transcript_5430/g.6256 Transcript_5430/m.6256 type:complete len:95 (-) Transcript_5430:3210-3494(-)